MATNAERKEHPISMRLPEADIAIIDRAAGLRGRSRTDFVRDAAVRAAEDSRSVRHPGTQATRRKAEHWLWHIPNR